MDLSGRGEAYRGVVVRCPGCGAPMRAEPVASTNGEPSTEVDVCDACGGLWIDWFDGDVSTIAAEAEAVRHDRGTPTPSAPPKAGICPRCTQSLAAEEYALPDAQPDDLIRNVELLRCSECAGSFLPRSSAHLLLERTQSPRQVGLWQALVEYVKHIVGAS